MKPLTAADIVRMLGGTLEQGSEEIIIRHGAYRIKQVKQPHTLLFTKVNIVDWERLRPFFPLVLVTDTEAGDNRGLEGLTIIRVPDADLAYWTFVDAYRNLFELPVIAITGTSGKTTTKEMIKHILSADKQIVGTSSSNNSRTAHLHYLLSIDDKTDAAVFETAVGAPGDILNAARFFKPTVGIITNIGTHHLNYCTTIESYIEAKCEMFGAVSPGGRVILNLDDPVIGNLEKSKITREIISVSTRVQADYRAEQVSYAEGGMQFILREKGRRHRAFVPGYGEHQVRNALCAIAASIQAGVKMEHAISRIATYKPLNKQLQIRRGKSGSMLIDDTWSLTTTSLEAALGVLGELGRGKKKVAVVGTITDLGSWGYTIHKKAGDMLAASGIDCLVTVGKHAAIMAKQAIARGGIQVIFAFNSHQRAIDLLGQIIDQDTVVLVKGDMYSKSIGLIAKALQDDG